MLMPRQVVALVHLLVQRIDLLGVLPQTATLEPQTLLVVIDQLLVRQDGGLVAIEGLLEVDQFQLRSLTAHESKDRL